MPKLVGQTKLAEEQQLGPITYDDTNWSDLQFGKYNGIVSRILCGNLDFIDHFLKTVLNSDVYLVRLAILKPLMKTFGPTRRTFSKIAGLKSVLYTRNTQEIEKETCDCG